MAHLFIPKDSYDPAGQIFWLRSCLSGSNQAMLVA